MRLIDVDALRADYGMAEDCKKCKTGYRSCEYDRIYSKMDFCGWLDDAPPVDAVPARHGKWVDENGNRPYGYRFNWLCSECGRPQHTSTAKLLKEFEEEHRWCHFCGARMDGKEGNGR